MFTGIIEGVGKVKSISKVRRTEKKRADTKMTIDLGRLHKGMHVGDSVSIDGACLTVTKISGRFAAFEMVNETMKSTSLSLLRPGMKVNIERSLRLGDRFGGHFVLGHVDNTAIIDKIIPRFDETRVWIRVENKEILRYIVPKGSVAVDGVSYTVVDVEPKKFSIVLTPHTLNVTTFGQKLEGDVINIELDIIGKYIINLQPKK
jgi:riboflavin synthase